MGTFPALPIGIPSQDTFGRVFAALDPAQFAACVQAWVSSVVRLTAGEVVAVDGKCLRRSHDRAAGKNTPALVSAWASANRLVLGQVAVDPASNEITATPELLRSLALKDSIVTVDAIGCQTDIAADIVERGAGYVLALKDNQLSLRQAAAVLFREGRAGEFAGLVHDHHRAVEKGHGRIEIRRTWAVSDPENPR